MGNTWQPIRLGTKSDSDWKAAKIFELLLRAGEAAAATVAEVGCGSGGILRSLHARLRIEASIRLRTSRPLPSSAQDGMSTSGYHFIAKTSRVQHGVADRLGARRYDTTPGISARAVKKVAIVQSNYIPWKGYFDLVNSVDEFILYDDMQFTRRDWRNRNLVKTPRGLEWLTIPVSAKGRYFQKICDTRTSQPDWGARHWSTLVHNYSKAPFFELYRPLLEPLYRRKEQLLSAVNFAFIGAICSILGIATRISWSMDYRPLKEGKTERLVDLCKRAGGTHYVSGPAARDYIDHGLFQASGIQLSFFDYAGYPEYPQRFGRFEHAVTVLDLLFNAGPQGPRFMKSFGLAR